ncbi:MAG: hypothetical protein LBP77_02400 [Rickettsiales bacterium]|jgi:hypothetical protein|uniref:Uncharacterized protein n=2 Tax=unclassified Wolbachia TaxID=2640676 RepID=A0AAU7YJV8_9RICK|nr:hypothetical protein [Rickettsia endosymbiont of Ceutorhynchus assimilis]MDR2045818.1 hypothetical protein [Rickettsiales bacterium]
MMLKVEIELIVKLVGFLYTTSWVARDQRKKDMDPSSQGTGMTEDSARNFVKSFSYQLFKLNCVINILIAKKEKQGLIFFFICDLSIN